MFWLEYLCLRWNVVMHLLTIIPENYWPCGSSCLNWIAITLWIIQSPFIFFFWILSYRKKYVNSWLSLSRLQRNRWDTSSRIHLISASHMVIHLVISCAHKWHLMSVLMGDVYPWSCWNSVAVRDDSEKMLQKMSTAVSPSIQTKLYRPYVILYVPPLQQKSE